MAAMGRDSGGWCGPGARMGGVPVRPRQRSRPQPCDPGRTCPLVTCWWPGGAGSTVAPGIPPGVGPESRGSLRSREGPARPSSHLQPPACAQSACLRAHLPLR